MWLTKKYYYVMVWEWIVVVIACTILFIYLYMQATTPNLMNYISEKGNKTSTAVTWATLPNILSEVENGDIVLLSGTTSGERMCKSSTNTIFSHVGFLFREKHEITGEDIVYILDCDVGQGTKDGVRVMRLIDKLHKYRGYRIGAYKKLVCTASDKYSNKCRPTLDKILEIIGRYQKIDFDDVIATWWVSHIPFLYKKVKNEGKMFCSEFVAKVYQDLGILKKNKVAAWYHPGDFHLSRLDLELGYSLGQTKFFDFSRKVTSDLKSSVSCFSVQEKI
jgi:hypothetical protein